MDEVIRGINRRVGAFPEDLRAGGRNTSQAISMVEGGLDIAVGCLHRRVDEVRRVAGSRSIAVLLCLGRESVRGAKEAAKNGGDKEQGK